MKITALTWPAPKSGEGGIIVGASPLGLAIDDLDFFIGTASDGVVTMLNASTLQNALVQLLEYRELLKAKVGDQ